MDGKGTKMKKQVMERKKQEGSQRSIALEKRTSTQKVSVHREKRLTKYITECIETQLVGGCDLTL